MKRKITWLAILCLLTLLGIVTIELLQPNEPVGPPYATKLPIISYHAIRTLHDAPLGMTVIDYDRFAEEMSYLHQQGYRTLSMDEVVQFLHGRKFPPKIVAIHFDDGLSSSLQALPLLLRYRFRATFWVIPGVSQPNPLAPGADRQYMNWETLELLDKIPRIGIYSHTMTHPWENGKTLVDWVDGRTPGKTADNALFELTESKKELEGHLGHPVPYLNWPSGIYNQKLTDMAKQAGYTAAVTADDGLNQPKKDLFHIQRIMISGNCSLKVFELMLADGIYRGCEN